jgi:hypothetical protein
MAFSPTDYRRLTSTELKRSGYSAGSKRRVLLTVKKITKATPTLTDRQYAQLRIKTRVGKEVTREQYSKLVSQGKINTRRDKRAALAKADL